LFVLSDWIVMPKASSKMASPAPASFMIQVSPLSDWCQSSSQRRLSDSMLLRDQLMAKPIRLMNARKAAAMDKNFIYLKLRYFIRFDNDQFRIILDEEI